MVERKGALEGRDKVWQTAGGHVSGGRSHFGFSKPRAEDVMFVPNVQQYSYDQPDGPINAQVI